MVARFHLILSILINRLFEDVFLTLQSIYESLCREKETVITTTGNAEAKAKKTTLVTALRNYNLVVMKAAFLFLQKQDEES